MKRFFNFRPLLWIFLTCIGAVYSVIKIFIGNYIPMIVFGVYITIIFALLTCSLIKKDIFKIFFEHFGIKSLKLFCIMILCSAILSASLSVLSFQLNSKRDFENGTYSISAKVKEIDDTGENISLLLGNVEIDGKSQNYNIIGSTNNETIEVGDKLNFDGYLVKRDLIKNETIQTYILKTKSFYFCSINDETVVIEKQNAGLIDSVKAKTKTVLKENMEEENAGFAYALLVGDKSLLSENYYSAFKNSGLAHVLAVSGLHVGFLVALIEILLKLCKVKGKYRFIAICGILLIYNILCNFSPSVFRASIMSICLLLGLVLGERNDILSNISLAGIIILAIMPLYLFDVGFLLSFASVFGIIFFAKPITNLLRKIKFPNFLAESVAVTLSATIGTIPFVFRYFGEYAPISILSNLLVLPIFSIMFSVLIICTFLNLIVSLPFLISFSQYFVNIVSNFSLILSKFGVISTLNFDEISIILYYAICIIVSPYFLISAKSKFISCLGFVICMTGTICLFNTQNIVQSNYIYVSNKMTPSSLYTTQSGKTILIDDVNSKFYDTKTLMQNLKINQLSCVVIFNYEDEKQDNVAQIVNEYNIQNVFVVGEFNNSTKSGLILALYKTNNIHFLDNSIFEIENLHFEIFKTANITKAVSITQYENRFLHIFENLTKTEILDNNNFFYDTEYKICFVKNLQNKYLEINAKSFVVKNAYISATDKTIEILFNDKLWTYSNNYATISA